jgi:hypothetical protein
MDVKKDILNHLGETKLDFTEILLALVHLYGEESNKLCETKLNELLNILLTKDGSDLAWFLYNTPEARKKLDWTYDTVSSKFCITEIK